MDDVERYIVEALREEASTVKQCFTTYSFQALALATTVLGAAFTAFRQYEMVAYAPLPVIALLMAVCRIGIFKYATANRNHGYELHLGRTARLPTYPSQPSRWRPEMRQLAWEEALRAWRVVQPTLFRQIYNTPGASTVGAWMEERHLGWINSLRPRLYGLRRHAAEMLHRFETEARSGRQTPDSYPWFLPKRLTTAGSCDGKPPAVYYSGSYLKTVMSVLVIMQYMLLLPLCLLVIDKTRPYDVVVLVIVAVLITIRGLRISRRREILEDELLSIHSCAIVWQAVVMAHFAAVADSRQTYVHYTEKLARQAQEVAEHAFRIHQWLQRMWPFESPVHPVSGGG